MIACSHPGKIGDLCYVWPTVQALAKKHKTVLDFYTSEYCRPMIPLLEYQPEVRRVIVPEDYKIEHFGTGIQPWEMPIPVGEYEAIYQLGLRGWPEKGLIRYYAELVGVEPEPYHFHCPDTSPFPGAIVVSRCMRIGRPYVEAVISTFRDRFPVVYLGWVGEQVPDGCANQHTYDFLETASILRQARAYAGGSGANSALAIAFYPTPCVIAFPARYDIRHLVPADGWVRYVREPTVEEFIRNVREIARA